MPPDGKLTSIDNTRLTAVAELGGVDKYGRQIKPEVRIRKPDEELSINDKLRFTKMEKGMNPQTWGEATCQRIHNQRPKNHGYKYSIDRPPRVTGRPAEQEKKP